VANSAKRPMDGTGKRIDAFTSERRNRGGRDVLWFSQNNP
jgi:hypothetical protein